MKEIIYFNNVKPLLATRDGNSCAVSCVSLMGPKGEGGLKNRMAASDQ